MTFQKPRLQTLPRRIARILRLRISDAASSDQILVSENIFREYGAADLFTQAKRRRLKGFSKPVLAFRCEWAGAGP